MRIRKLCYHVQNLHENIKRLTETLTKQGYKKVNAKENEKFAAPL